MHGAHGLEIELFRAFIAVAKNLSFTRAAEELGTTQPLLSRSIRRLEDVVGEALFDRSRRQIALTPAGAAFLSEAQAILDRVNLALRRAQMAGYGSPRTLRVGYVGAMWMHSIHWGVRKFRARHPEVTLDLRMMPADEQANALRGGEIEVGLMGFSKCDLRDLTWRIISRESYVMAIPSEWPFDPGRPIDLAALRDRPFLIADPDIAPEIHAASIDSCVNAGFQPRVVKYTRDGAELRFLVAAGMGAGFAFASALQTRMDGIHFAPMTPALTGRFMDSQVVWAPHRAPPLVREFVDCMISESYAAVIVPQAGSYSIEWRRTNFEHELS
jgi:DNA-binding transcriptional LysR family regulator